MARTPTDPPANDSPVRKAVKVAQTAGILDAPPDTPPDTPPESGTTVTPPLAAAAADRLAVKSATAPSAAGSHPILWTALVFAGVILALAFLWGSREPVPDAAPQVDARSEILAIERLLDDLAFPPGKIDGVADAETEAAIRDYQRAAGLPVDGYATPALLEELRAVTGTD